MTHPESELVIFDRQTKEERSYWLDRLSQEIEVSTIQYDYPRGINSPGQIDVVDVNLPDGVYENLLSLTKGGSFLLYTTLIAALKVCLHKYTGSRLITVGSPARRLGPDVAQQPNLVTLLDTIDTRAPFHHLLKTVRQTLLDAYARQQYPFSRLIKDLGLKNGDAGCPLFSLALSLDEIHFDWPQMNLDIRMNFERKDNRLAGRVVYERALYRRETIERFVSHYVNLLAEAVANPSRTVENLTPLKDSERRQILVEWNNEASQETEPLCVHLLVESQAAARPDALAVASGDEQITYGELNRRSNQLARYLQSLGVGPEMKVGLCLGRSLGLVVGQLAVLKAGGAFLPLDPALPTERLSYMVEDAQAHVLITEEQFLDRLPSNLGTVLTLDTEWEKIAPESDERVTSNEGPKNLAYVIYTSGSTGRPKGVAIEHAGLSNLVRWHQKAFEVKPEDRASQVAGLGFDASVWEIWPYLASGASLHLVDEVNRATPSRLVQWLAERAVTICFLPTLWMEMAMAGEWPRGLALRAVLTGGDRLHRGPKADTPFQMVNNYGPTEGTVVSTWIALNTNADGSINPPIGRPITNVQTYLLDGSGQLVPVGVAGELHIGGDSLARGYVESADLTAEKFLPNPFSRRPGSRLYRTGDLARYTSEGEIEFQGRTDHQVKVRGYRIELGEIESAMSNHPAVEDVVVVSREDQTANKQLVAYVVAKQEGGPTQSEWRRYLSEKMPDYMVPSAYVTMKKLPLTPSGKVDRRALPAPEQERPELDQIFVAPVAPTERILAEIWADVLGLAQVGVHDNYFELGGDSIRSIQIAAKAQEHGLNLSLHQLFECPTIAELAKVIGPAQVEAIAPEGIKAFALISAEDQAKVPDGVEDAYPLTHTQAGMLFHSEYSPESAVYHNVLSFHLQCMFNPEVMRAAVSDMISRHDVLRTSFDLLNFSEPLQLVHREVESPLEIHDIRHMELDEQERFLLDEFEAEKRPFNWNRAPLLRLKFYRRTEGTFQLLLTFHHAILDGWSDSTLLTDLFRHYWYLMGEATADIGPPPTAKLRDYVALEQETVASTDGQQYWRENLRDVNVTRLPRRRRSNQSSKARQVRAQAAHIPSEILDGLNSLAKSNGVPIKDVLLAAHLKVLSWTSGQDDVVTGIVSHGRPDGADGERLLGLFLNTLPFRLQMPGGTWKELIKGVFDAEREMLPHRRFPLVMIQKMLGVSSLFEAVFNFTHFYAYQQLSEMEGKLASLGSRSAVETNFTFVANFGLDPFSSQMRLSLFFDDTEFGDEEISLLMGYYLKTLAAIASVPAERYELFAPLADEERHQLLREWNDSQASLPAASVHSLFEEQADNLPDAVAIVSHAEYVTYGKLNERANQLAHLLQSLNVGPETLVGIYMERSVEMITGMLAVLKAGGAYLPLDSNNPTERLAFMLDDSQLQVLLTHNQLLDSLPATSTKTICLDSAGWAFDDLSDLDPVTDVSPLNLAYVIYTSGSTGLPKAVAVPHSALMNLVSWHVRDYSVSSSDHATQLAGLGFDAAVWETWPYLAVGASLHLPTEEVRISPARLIEWLDEQGVTISFLPTPLAEAAMREQWPQTHSLRKMLTGGDRLHQGAGAGASYRLYNNYGPTENAVVTTWCEVEAGTEEEPSIGRVIANAEVYVVDRRGEEVGIGITGELEIGGESIARGYVRRAEQTAERFIPDSRSGREGARVYRSGDVVRHRANGEIEYVGRSDQQVKVRGYRIEVGEVESVMRKQGGVEQVVVEAREDEEGRKQLVAYVVMKEGAEAKASEIREYMRGKVPEYMVPVTYVELDEMPMTANGKIDRKALPAPDHKRPELEGGSEAPRTQIEDLIADTWKQVLNIETLGINDNFFDLGGHSLLATQVMSRLRRTFQVEVPLRRLFEVPTVAGLAAAIEAAQREGLGIQAPSIVPVSRDSLLPLSFAQRRLWFFDQLMPGSSLYNNPTALRIAGNLNRPALEQSFSEITRRHEVLRTTFATVNSEPVQVIASASVSTLPIIDLCGLPEAERTAEARRLAGLEARRPFDLSRGPLLRASLLKLDEQDHTILVTMHHIITDGWSTGLFDKEAGALYESFSVGNASPFPELVIQYADFASWQRQWLQGEVLDRELAYWKRQLGGNLPALRLPADRPRPPVPTWRGETQSSVLPPALLNQLRALSRQERVTLFMTLLAAFQTLLHRYSGQDDIIVGTDIANRNRTETEGLIGLFVNLLTLRTDLSSNPSFRELLGRVREVTLGAFAHQDMPFDKLVEELRPERSLNVTPLFQVLFILQNTPRQSATLSDLNPDSSAVGSAPSRFDLTLSITETDQGLAATWRYNTDLFDATTIARMIKHFETLLNNIVAQPEARLDAIEMLTETEKRQQVMQESKREESNFKKFKSTKPRAISLPQGELVNTSLFSPDQSLPLVMQPDVANVDLTRWAKSNSELIEKNLLKHGAILFRDFGIRSATEFEDFAATVCPNLFNQYGDLPRENAGRNIYSSTPYPSEQAILFHNESSHMHQWPGKILFYCIQAASQGGETPIVDCRKVYQLLDPQIRERFEQKRLMYVRNYIDGLDVSWQEFFQTSDRLAVEEFCKRASVEFEWNDEGQLTTRKVCEAVAAHPKTGERIFFNQVQLHHPSCLLPATRQSLLSLVRNEDSMPRNVYYGDGSRIEDSVISEIRKVYDEAAVSFPWQEGDILMLDNMLAAHGRNPYVGPRKNVVAMGDMITQEELTRIGDSAIDLSRHALNSNPILEVPTGRDAWPRQE